MKEDPQNIPEKQTSDLFQNDPRLKMVLDNSRDAIYCINMSTGRYEFISASCKKISGYTAAELMAMSPYELLELVHPDYRDFLNEALSKSREGDFSEVEYPQKNRYGEYRWFSNHMTIIRDEAGKTLYRIGNIRDVTFEKETVEALRESESRYRTIVETAQEGICRLDKELRIIYANQKTIEMCGYPAEEMIGKHIFELMEKETADFVRKKSESAIPGTHNSYQLKLVRKDRQEVFVLVNTFVLSDMNGKYNGSVCMLTDITERVKAESDLKKTRKRLESALKTGNIGTWEFNSKTEEISWDKRTQEIFGAKSSNYKDASEYIESRIHEEDYPHVREVFERILATGENGDVIFRTKAVHGKCNYVLAKAMVHRDRKGRSTGMSGVVFDVTDMKEGAERTLIELNEALLKSNSDLQQFAYVASHDLQEPLRMVSSFTQLLQQKYHDRLDEDANDYIHYAVEGSKRMYELINSLLAYSRVQSRARDFSVVDMNSVVEKVIANLNLIITEREALIEYGKLPTVFAEANQMIQLVQNLVENGMKFSKGRPHITISCEKKKNQYVFSVRDRGIGIESQYFDRIFRIFQKLHAGDHYPGTGIGLAICKKIIDRHGGKIWVNSEPGSGSEFFFSLPGR